MRQMRHPTKDTTMTPTLHELIGDNPAFLPELRAWIQQHEGDHGDQQQDGDSPVRAAVQDSAPEPVESDALEPRACAHGVLTYTDARAVTCDDVAAPVSQTESAEVRNDQRTGCSPRYSTDPDQSLRDLKRRTRRDLAGEVRRLRRECARVRRRLRDAEQRISELEEAPRV